MFQDRKYLMKMAKRAIEISEKGYYEIPIQYNEPLSEPDTIKVSLPSMSNSITYRKDDLDQIVSYNEALIKVANGPDHPPLVKPFITVENTTTISAIISQLTHSTSDKKDKGIYPDIGVLNFASAKHPGGGFKTGSNAQEESLAYRSNLYWKIKDSEMYQINWDRKGDNGIYSDTMISSDVSFFALDDFAMITPPVTVKVVTAPAVNAKYMREHPIISPAGINVTEGLISTFMYDRMKYIINLFIKMRCRILILGAFGCGVFGNVPAMVCEHWNKLINKYGTCFDRVIFAVTGPNYIAFDDMIER